MSNKVNWKNEIIIKTVSWVIGEFGEALQNNDEGVSTPVNIPKLLDIFKKFQIRKFSNATNSTIVTSLAKLYSKIDDQKIRSSIDDVYEVYMNQFDPFLNLKITQFRILF